MLGHGADWRHRPYVLRAGDVLISLAHVIAQGATVRPGLQQVLTQVIAQV